MGYTVTVKVMRRDGDAVDAEVVTAFARGLDEVLSDGAETLSMGEEDDGVWEGWFKPGLDDLDDDIDLTVDAARALMEAHPHLEVSLTDDFGSDLLGG